MNREKVPMLVFPLTKSVLKSFDFKFMDLIERRDMTMLEEIFQLLVIF